MTTPHDGHRCYDGCPDSTMQRRLDHEAARYAELRKKFPDARAVRFFGPTASEDGYQVWVNLKPIGRFRHARLAAIESALAGETPS